MSTTLTAKQRTQTWVCIQHELILTKTLTNDFTIFMEDLNSRHSKLRYFHLVD